MPQTGSFTVVLEEAGKKEIDSWTRGEDDEAPSVTKPEETTPAEVVLLKYFSGCALNFSAHPAQQK